MAEDVRWLMSGLGSSALEALPGFVGGLLSGTVSGYLVARAGVVYQQRAAAVAEVRRLALEAARTFDGWTWRLGAVGGRNEYYLKGFYEIAARVDVLAASYGIHAEWLGSRARESVEKIIDGISDHNSRMMETAGEDEEKAREVAATARQWHERDLRDLIADVRARSRWGARSGRR